MDAFFGSRLMNDLYTGINAGAIYALVALSLVIIWQSTHILNFAQGAMAMFATYVGLTLTDRSLPYALCVLIAVVFGFLLGGATERVLVRPLYGKPEINPIVVMVGFLGLLEFLIQAIWSNTERTINPPFTEQYFHLGGHLLLLSPWILFRLGLALAIMLGMAGLFRFTNLGLQLRAAAAAPEVSRLLGVRVGRLLTFGWMISCAVGAVAAIVYTTGTTGMTPTAMDLVFVSGFIAAAIGGLESPVGAVIGALMLGVVTALVTDYWSTNAGQAAPLVLLVVVLAVRPQGLFTTHVARRV
jgi:branched-chain amino acid transport system permease protein